MRIFLAGGTGVLGRVTVPMLVAAGHEVTAIARSPEKAAQLSAAGARPVEVSLFDPDALRTAVAGHDAVVNLATKVPPPHKAARPAAWEENIRLRTEGSTNLVDAALAAGASRLVQESLAFAYEDHGDEWVPPGAPLGDLEVSASLKDSEGNAGRFGDAGGAAVVLRFGRFYGSESAYSVTQVRAARVGVSFEMGSAEGYQPLIDITDAAAAVVAALAAPGGTYDIVDAEPLRRTEIDDVFATAVGRRRARRFLDPILSGREATALFERSNRVSSEPFRSVTDWHPRTANCESGLRRLVADLGGLPGPLTWWTHVTLWILALSALTVGLQAQFLPASFYDDFPLGRGWIAADGPFNEHLIRDVGGLQLALFVMTCAALLSRRTGIVRAVGVATLAYALPHALYHAGHLDGLAGIDSILIVAGTWGPVLLAFVLVALPVHRRL